MDDFSLDDVRGFYTQDMESFLRQIEEATHTLIASSRLARPPKFAGRRGKSPFATAAELARSIATHADVRRDGAVAAMAQGLGEVIAIADGALQGVEEELERAHGNANVIEEAHKGMRRTLDAALARDAGVDAIGIDVLKLFDGHEELIEEGRSFVRYQAEEEEHHASREPLAELAPIQAVASGSVPFGSFVERLESTLTRFQNRAAGFEADPIVPDPEPMMFFAVRDFSHAMAGSSSLVGQHPLAEVARRLEWLSCGAGLLVERALSRIRIGRRVAQFTLGSLPFLVHAHALDHAQDEIPSIELSAQFLAAVEVLKALLAAPLDSKAKVTESVALEAAAEVQGSEQADPEAAFDFGSVVEGGPRGEPDQPSEDGFLPLDFEEAFASTITNQRSDEPSLDQELLEIFHEEARQVTLPLQGYISTLVREHSATEVLRQLEKLFHTLKGSSSTVGLNQISSLAAGLEDTVEALLESSNTAEIRVNAAFVEDLVQRTNDLLRLSGLQTVSVDMREPVHAAAPQRSAASDELQEIFLIEAEEITRELEPLVRQMNAAGRDSLEFAEAVASVARLFHRLKGAAVLNDAAEVGRISGDLQDACEMLPPAVDVGQRARAAVRSIQGILGEMRTGRVEPRSEVFADSQMASAAASATGDSGRFAVLHEPIEIETDAVWEAFEIESQETLESMDRDAVAIERSEQPRDVLRSLFRSYHTLKGALNTVGLGPVAKLLHRVEDFMEELAEATVLPPLPSLSRFLLKLQESLRSNLRQARQGFVEVSPARLEAELSAVRTGQVLSTSQSVTRDESLTATAASERSRSQSKGSSATGSSSKSGTKTKEKRYIRVPSERLEGLMNLTGELVVNRARLHRRVGQLKSLQRDLVLFCRRLLHTVDGFREQYEFSTLSVQRQMRSAALVTSHASREFVGAGSKSRGGSGGSGGFGGSSSYDNMFSDIELDRYEDINILARSLNEITSDINELQQQVNGVLEELGDDSEHFSGTVSDLQAEIMQARMVPVDQLFIRLHGPVRDAAEREQKDVRVSTSGEDVTLDKTIVDELYTPLLHLVRNAVSHGVEHPEVRRRAGKPSQGQITIRARAESGQIILEVADDGGGLDLPAIHRRGVEMGLISADTPVDSPTVKELIFATGLSVRSTASDVAGRGVGCDVVRRDIERLNGSITLSSQPGVGTTFTITLPLTLAIYRALVVRSAGQIFAYPLNLCEMIVDLDDVGTIESGGVRRVKYRGVYLAVEELGTSLGMGAGQRGNAAVVVRMGEQRLAVCVDNIVGQDEIVVKGMGELLVDHPLFSGVTISGDGQLILIVDIPGLLASQRRRGNVDVPIAQEAAAPALPALAPAKGKERHGPGKDDERRGAIRVLYIDDSLSVRKAAEKLLKNLGVHVTLAIDGADGLEKVRQTVFDMVFTDLEMPRLNGYDMIRELRYVNNYKDVPVVVVTSRSGEKHRQQASVVGANDYVTKPFNQEVLEQKLAKWTRYRANA